ncbi:DUF1365 domain-containing protein [Bdellovibrio sp. qaytius]|nr:DUF1365 domain-containing protein [Bdellovibrio sp. qaytius]
MSLYLMQGHVYHSRTETAKNSFKYPIFNIYFHVNDISELKNILKSKFKSFLSFNDQDYLQRDQKTSINDKSKAFLKEHFNYEAEYLFLQTIPRMFGYAFNPVNFWYCYRGEKLDAVLCEVNNTFGETHYYWLHKNGEDLTNKWLKAEKRFHVSPFFNVEGEYRFRFSPRDESLYVDINFYNNDGSLKLKTWVEGRLTPLEEASFVKLLLNYGWMTPLVVFRIHYQALKLFFKKVKFFSKPVPPSKEITHGTSFLGR